MRPSRWTARPIEAPAGTIVFISDPEVKRKAVADEQETTVLAVGAKPGEAFTPSGWEWFFQASEQQPEQGIATMRAGIEKLGRAGAALYHLACMEAKAGRLEDAKEHLAHALELDPKFEEFAASGRRPEGGAMSGYKVAQLDEIEEMSDGTLPLAAGPPPLRHPGLRDQLLDGARGRRPDRQRARGGGRRRRRGALRRAARPRDLRGRRRQGRRARGTLVFVPPNTRRTAFAKEAGTTVLVIGAPPGRAYEAFGWESGRRPLPYYSSGDYDKAIEVLTPIVADHPEYAGPLYNLACLESLAGRKDDAVGHLRTAIERSPRFQEIAKGDSDFDPIREEPAFKELVG